MPWWVYAIIAVVAIIVLWIVAVKVNRHFLRNYGVSLFVGGFFTLVALGLIAGGILLAREDNGIGWALLAAGAVILLIVLIVDFKKCGFGAGLLALLLQIVFAAPSILMFVDLVFNHGRSTFGARLKSSRAHNEYLANRNRNDDDQ